MPQDGVYPAGTNRSGAKRKRVTSTAETASTDTAGGSAGRLQAGSDQGEQVLEGQTGGNRQLISDRDGDMANTPLSSQVQRILTRQECQERLGHQYLSELFQRLRH